MIRPHPHTILCVLLLLLGILPGPSPLAQEDGGDTVEDPNPAGIRLQRDHAAEFVGGEELLVQVSIDASDEVGLFALGLYENVPSGWTFEGLYVDAGPAPDILPPQGATGVLEFGWVSPAVPVVLRYALRIPARDAGARFITGQVEYRLESDPRRNSAPLMTQLEGVANELPVLSLIGAALLPWTLNETFVDPGARAQDAEDGDLSSQVQVAGQVDVTTPGEYTLTYGVSDSAGNRANPVSRTVRVQATANPDSADGSAGDGIGDPEMADIGAPGIPEAAPIPRSSNAQPGLNISVPPISLGDNSPMHVLPPGEDVAAQEKDVESGQTEEGRLFRESPSLPQIAATRDGAQETPAPAATPSTVASSDDEKGMVWSSRRILIVVIVLIVVIPAIVGAARQHTLHSPTHRRRK